VRPVLSGLACRETSSPWVHWHAAWTARWSLSDILGRVARSHLTSHSHVCARRRRAT